MHRGDRLQTRFNRILFDVELYFFSQLENNDLTKENNSAFIAGLTELSQRGSDFRNSLTSSTSTKRNYAIRFNLFRNLINVSFKKEFAQVLEVENNE